MQGLRARSGNSAFGRRGLIAIMLVALMLPGCAKLQANVNPDIQSVAFVNGQVVEAREFAAVLMGERAKTQAYFQDKYGAEDSPAMWNRNYGGEVPLDKIMKDALRKIVKIKVQQSLGKEYGLLKNASYTAYLDELNQENERRKKEVGKGRPVYGPKQLTEKTFYDMRQSQLLEDLKRKISDRTAIGDPDIQAYYDQNQNQFVQAGTTKVNLIAIPYNLAHGLSKKDAESSMNGILARLKAGEEFTVVAIEYCQSLPSVFVCKEQTFSADTAKADAMTSPQLTSAVKGLQKNEISGLMEEQQAFLLAQCIDKQPDTVMALADVRDAIAAKLSDLSFERFLQDEVSRVQLVVNEEVIKTVAVTVLQGK